jgi:hypothetical protein
MQEFGKTYASSAMLAPNPAYIWLFERNSKNHIKIGQIIRLAYHTVSRMPLPQCHQCWPYFSPASARRKTLRVQVGDGETQESAGKAGVGELTISRSAISDHNDNWPLNNVRLLWRSCDVDARNHSAELTPSLWSDRWGTRACGEQTLPVTYCGAVTRLLWSRAESDILNK